MTKEKTILGLIAGGLVLVGVGYSVKDYRAWQHAELDRYGQGYADTRAAALPLTTLYENRWAGVRVRTPEGWLITEERVAKFATDTFENQTILDKPVKAAKIGEMLVLNVTRTTKTIPDATVEEKNQIEKMGKMLREGEGLQLDTADEGRILTWEVGSGSGEMVVYQEALVKRGNKMVRLTGKVVKSEWPKWEKTWIAMFRSMVLF